MTEWRGIISVISLLIQMYGCGEEITKIYQINTESYGLMV